MRALHKISFFTLMLLTFAAMTLVLSMNASAKIGDKEGVEAIVTDSITGAKHSIYSNDYNGTPTLFVPGSVDTKSIDILCEGKIWTVDASSGKVEIEGHNINVMHGGNVGAVFVELDGGDRAFINVCRNKENSESGKLIMIDRDGKTRYAGGLDTFKGHGLTSFSPANDTSRKNSYNIKLEKKSELLDGTGKIKKYVLLSPRLNDWSRDMTGLSQLYAYRTFTNLVGDGYCGIVGDYVDLYVNGDYRGVYILCERMNAGGAVEVTDLEDNVSGGDRLKKVRSRDAKKGDDDPALALGIREYSYVDGATVPAGTDITGGYVLEVMHEQYEDCGFITSHGIPFHIKTPEACTKEMVQYIASYVQNLEDAIYSETGYSTEGRHYSEYADVASMADMTLVYAFFENFEFYRTSTYMYKDADGTAHEKLTFGPVWDFETTSFDLADESFFGTSQWFTYFVDQQYAWCEQLWQHGDFMAVMYAENERMRDALDDANASIKASISDVTKSQKMSEKRWNTSDYDELAQMYVDAVRARKHTWYNKIWSDKNLLGLDVDAVLNDDGTVTMTANVKGTSSGNPMWYVLSDSDMSKYTLHNNHSDSITVPADGKRYFYVASGKNNAYLDWASGAIFSDDTITMRSAAVAADADALRPPETEPPVTETAAPETEPAASGGCGSTLGTGAIFALTAAVCGAALMKKRRNIK